MYFGLRIGPTERGPISYENARITGQPKAGDRVKEEFAKIVLDVVYDGFKERTHGTKPFSSYDQRRT